MNQQTLLDTEIEIYNGNRKLFALREAWMLKRRAIDVAMRDKFYDLFVAPYDREIQDIDKQIADQNQKLLADAKRLYFLAKSTAMLDGEIIHPKDFKALTNVTMKVKPTEYTFPPDFDLVAAAKAAGEKSLIRVKEEINLLHLKAGLREGRFDWAQATPVEDVNVQLAPTGDIVIMAESE